MRIDDDQASGVQRPFEETLRHDEGVLDEPGGRESSCEPAEEPCAPSDYVEEPFADDGTPGTADDLPYTLGVEESAPADEHIVPVGGTRLGEAGPERAEDAADERELWGKQKALVEEDEASGLRLEGASQDAIPGILDAMGDDAAEALPDWPEGTSATGKGTEAEHGGFPTRED
jgi:hypothetical protein